MGHINTAGRGRISFAAPADPTEVYKVKVEGPGTVHLQFENPGDIGNGGYGQVQTSNNLYVELEESDDGANWSAIAASQRIVKPRGRATIEQRVTKTYFRIVANGRCQGVAVVNWMDEVNLVTLTI